jgi:tetratricopeptide (TPR) repeat protein
MWVSIRSLGTVLSSGLPCAALLITGCATGGSQGIALLSGTSGGVSWEIVDVSQAGDPGKEVRWSYTLVLRGTGTAIQFETLQTGSEGRAIEGGVDTQPFAERLEEKGRLLIDGSYAIHWDSGPTFDSLDRVQIFYRLSGKDALGAPVRVDIRFLLDRGTGTRKAEPPPARAPRGGVDHSSSGLGQFAHQRLAEGPTALETALLEDLRDGRLDRHSDLDAALIVSGARDYSELASLRRRFAEATSSSLKRAARLSTPRERAATLLAALHPTRTTETPLLRQYALDATTLLDVIETGRYNCVSATIVFLLLGRTSGLDASAVLLPSHARAVVRIDGGRVPVEATDALGFDPGEAQLRQIQRRFRVDNDVGPSSSGEAETDVDFLALLGAIYTNVATYRTRDGDAAAAVSLARRADAFVAPSERVVLNQVRVGLLSEMAVDSSKRGRHAEAVSGFQEARRLVTEKNDTAAYLTESLTAVALAWLHEIAPSAEDAQVLGFSDRFAEEPTVKAEVRSFSLRLLAHRRAEQAQWEQALADLREAAILTRIPEYHDRIGRDLAHIELRYVDDLTSRDAERAWQAFQALQRDEDDEELSSVRMLVSHRVVVARLRHLADEQRCEELEAPLALWRDLDASADPDAVSASCHGNRGLDLWERGELERATDDFRRAYRLAPRDPVTEHNLLVALQRLVADRVRDGRCPDARPLIAEGLSVAPGDALLRPASAACGLGP